MKHLVFRNIHTKIRAKMKPLLYKVDTNFFETPLNKGFQRVLLIEWE